jgi:hypothetical protein
MGRTFCMQAGLQLAFMIGRVKWAEGTEAHLILELLGFPKAITRGGFFAVGFGKWDLEIGVWNRRLEFGVLEIGVLEHAACNGCTEHPRPRTLWDCQSGQPFTASCISTGRPVVPGPLQRIVPDIATCT